MKTNHIFSVVSVGAALTLFTSCQESDIESPSVCTEPNATNSILLDEIEAMAGTTISVEDTFCDNQRLSEVRWDVHNAADHAHEQNAEEEGLIFHSGTEWEVLEMQSLQGTSDIGVLTLDIPLTARGVWDVVLSLVDAEGNAAADVVTQLHIENDHIPAFSLTDVGGADPNQWAGEPVWSAGADIGISGTVQDSDGLSSASLELVHEATEEVLWEIELAASEEQTLTFQIVVNVPASAIGECHFEMKASDVLGNETETGFHVEVE